MSRKREAGSGLQYEPMPVEELLDLRQYYSVPRYQRGFAWGNEEIKELLSDLDEAFREFPEEAYLLGQIIVCPSTEEITEIDRNISQWDLIDGQQRCTTLYLLVITASKMLERQMESTPSAAMSRKFAWRENLRSIQDQNKDDVIYPRVKAASNGGEFILRILLGEALPTPDGPTQVNIANAVEQIESHLETYNFDQLDNFLEFVLTHVWIVRLSLESSAHALRVFQKVNNRGLSLDDADLIKNFLFQRVSYEEFLTLSEKWETATITLSKSRMKRVRSMEFLMKAMIGIRTGISVPTGNLYREWEKLLTDERQVQELAATLPDSASYLRRISLSQLPKTQENTDLTLGTFMQGWIQQFEILLAGCHLDEPSYRKLLRMVEDRTMLSYWAKEPSQAFERIIHPWAKAVSELDPSPSESEFWASGAKALENFDDLADRAFIGIQKLTYLTISHRDRIRYILARVNKAFQDEYHSIPLAMRDLMQTSRGDQKGFDLDHVFPKSISLRDKWLQSEEKNMRLGFEDRYEQSINSLGNLILLHPDDNRSQSDSLPWTEEKIKNIAGSELNSNKILGNKDYWKPTPDRVAPDLLALQEIYHTDLNTWNEDTIDRRTKFYWNTLLTDIKKNLNYAQKTD
jgi:hypothetical protein